MLPNRNIGDEKMKIRNFDKHGKEIGDLTEITIEADATIKAVIAAIEERNNNELRRIKESK